MEFYVLLVLALGLSLDAFAVSFASSATVRGLHIKYGLRMALFFGVFQTLMPALGWALGRAFVDSIKEIDHWVAFGLLAFVGGRMVWAGFPRREEPAENACDDGPDCRHLPTLVMLSLATSLDALAIGVTFALVDVNIVVPVVFIGLVTFIVCMLGYFLGAKVQKCVRLPLELLGGVVLISIGCKILIGDLFF